MRRFVLINHSNEPDLQKLHGKLIALDMNLRHAPFPSIFLIHEARVRASHPFAPNTYTLPSDIPWQDWITTEGVFDESTGRFKTERPPVPPGGDASSFDVPTLFQLPFGNTPGSASQAEGNTVSLALDQNAINDILAATRASLSWKTCQIEGTSWDGTTEENIKKYKEIMGDDT